MPELTEQNKSNIRQLWAALPEYSAYIAEELRIRISPEDVLLALMEATGKEFHDIANLTCCYVFLSLINMQSISITDRFSFLLIGYRPVTTKPYSSYFLSESR